ncbi:hypothetical protein BJ742DRAFT_775273 [Cladochytrium replicatum]|nr:hypothetical protein BJ742DRAFT_775273 [Cladochytrium replicatum]
MDPGHKAADELGAPVEPERPIVLEDCLEKHREGVPRPDQYNETPQSEAHTDVDSPPDLQTNAKVGSRISPGVPSGDTPGAADVHISDIPEQNTKENGETEFGSNAAGPSAAQSTDNSAHEVETVKSAENSVALSDLEVQSASDSRPTIEGNHHLLSNAADASTQANQASGSVDNAVDYVQPIEVQTSAAIESNFGQSIDHPEIVTDAGPVPLRPDGLELPLIAARPASRTSNRSRVQQEYRLKAVELPHFSGSTSSDRGYPGQSNTKKIKIITQNENGPCPLLSLCNVMILRGDMELNYDAGWVTYEHLVTLLGEYLFSHSPTFDPHLAKRRKMTEEQLASFAQNLNDVMDLMPSLQTGLDVNVRFDSPYSFETTPSLLVFDIFSIALCHGWTVDHQDDETYRIVVRDLGSYNRVVESIIAGDVAEVELAADAKKRAESGGGPLTDEEIEVRRKWERAVHEGMVAKDFLHTTASQLTIHGLSLLTETLPANSYSVIFRNNHFSVVWKRSHNEPLLTLVTDQGFLEAPGVVWETLDNVEGDSMFLDGFGRVYAPDRDERPAADVVGQKAASAGIVGDYPELLAQPDEDRTADDDFALALSLQDEENARHQEYLQRQQREQQYTSHQTRGQGDPIPPWHQHPTDHRARQQQQERDLQQQRHQQSQRMERKRSEDNCSLM